MTRTPRYALPTRGPAGSASPPAPAGPGGDLPAQAGADGPRSPGSAPAIPRAAAGAGRQRGARVLRLLGRRHPGAHPLTRPVRWGVSALRRGLARAAAGVCPILLAACTAGGPLPQPEVAPGTPAVLSGGDGRPLALSVWGAQAPRAVILAVHGYGDYGPSTFGAAAAAWARAGIRTYAYDQRGFGRNPSRGAWPGAEALVADLRAAACRVRARHPGVPLVVVGHSMGGGVALAAGPRLAADALVLAAPAIWGGARLNPLQRAAAWTAAALVPERRFTGEGVVRIRASDNSALLVSLARDPLYLRPPSAREMLGLVRVMDLAVPAAARVAMPALLLTGDRDQIVPRAVVEAVFERLAGPRDRRRYPQGWHLLFRDREAPRVWRDVADWVLARAAPDARPGRARAGPASDPCPAPRRAARHSRAPGAMADPHGPGSARGASPAGRRSP